MAICGFNDKIGQGLGLLVEGMIEALQKKAVSTSAAEVLQREIVELDTIVSVLRTAPGQVLPEMFIGLNLLARSMFIEVERELRNSKSGDLGTACRKICDELIDLLARTEMRSQEMRQLANNKSIAIEARNLALWALQTSTQLKPQECPVGEEA
jgi:hypothetical protein